MQVRAAATLGGNLVLTRDLGLESDAATLLIAAEAEVQTVTPGSKPSWQTVEGYVSGPSKANQGEVIIAIRLPPIKAGDKFWSFKVWGTAADQCMLFFGSPVHLCGVPLEFLRPAHACPLFATLGTLHRYDQKRGGD